MRWPNVRVIFRREVRDQLRDRRTLLMIFVLPVLLYPMLGLGTAKLAEAFRATTRKVILIGAENLPEAGFGSRAMATTVGVGTAAVPLTPTSIPLLNESGTGFNPALFEDPADAELMRVESVPRGTPWSHPVGRRVGLRQGSADVVIEVPPDLGAQLSGMARAEIPIYYNSADERSQMTFLRVDRLVERWRELIVAQRVAAEGKPQGFTEPVRSEAKDVATASEAGSTVWAKIFPFLLVMMALTGAFYPAVDLCAGEKERGTMETLLISPASRSEIVVGKFLTVMLFSMGTALLNILSMGITAWLLARQFRQVGPAGGARPGVAALMAAPGAESVFWMIVLLVPLAAFFSAVCLSLAILARSMKEGQYYMTPLYMVALPLIFITLAPGVELTAYTCLIPITGASLLLKTLMLGKYGEAKTYFLPVMVPILVYGLLALRWAVDQFKSESVLFREAERFSIRLWLRHLVRDRGPTPGQGAALTCFVLMLMAAWLAMNFLGPSIWSIPAMQIGVVLLPPVALALLFTSDPARTLRLRAPSWRFLALGVALALTLNPLVNELRTWVEWLLPTPEPIRKAMAGLFGKMPDFGTALVLVALVPAICEEVAFRGFILSGLQSGRRTRSAVLLSAFLFGFLHVILSLTQQFFNATLLGLVLGLLAIRSGSLLPAIAFHFLNNGLALATGVLVSDPNLARVASALYRDRAEGLYHGHWVALGAIVSGVLLVAVARAKPRGSEPGEADSLREPIAEVEPSRGVR